MAVSYTHLDVYKRQVVYQLDFYPMKKSERASYLQLFKDCGWEHITDFNGFSYFRKLYSGVESDVCLLYTSSTVEVPKGLPFIPDDLKPKMELVSRKPILPSKEELEANNRSHSAKLRVARKIHK